MGMAEKSLTEKLLSIDRSKLEEVQTGDIEIKRLSKMFGEPFIVKCKEVDGDRMIDLQSMLLGKDGTVDSSKSRDVFALICCEGVVEPDLTNKELQSHFNAASPKDLAKKLFKGVDLMNVGDKIATLSNYVDDEEETKN